MASSSSFTQAVFAVVRKIPKGETLTYGQVAIKAGYPSAARAVGTVLKGNYDPKIPCHRVIRSDGSLGEYNRGAELKRERLVIEGAIIKNDMTPTVGKKAPTWKLPDQDGNLHSLADYAGFWILIYFYPKDDTPGCTKEACSFRDHFPKFKKLSVHVFGVSVDSPKKHTKFIEKYHLPFTLLADEDKKMVNGYGVWAKKKFMGREYMGTLRTSFLIDPQGKIAKIYDNVKPETHVEEVLNDLKTLQK